MHTQTVSRANEVPTVSTEIPATIQITPASTPKPFISPTHWSRLSNYDISWLIPADWETAGEQLSRFVPDAILVYASADRDIAPLLPFSPLTRFPNGLMLMTVQTEFAPRPQLPGAEPVNISGRPGWEVEIVGKEAEPFLLRTMLFLQTPANSYSILFDCAPPNSFGFGETDFEMLCQDVWDKMVAGLKVFDAQLPAECPLNPTPTPGAMNWRQVNSSSLTYNFEVPVGWLEQRGSTPDRLTFISDWTAAGQPDFCALPNGLMKLEFTVNLIGSGAPNLQGFTPTTIANQPAWIITKQEGDSASYSSVGIQSYVEGSDYWYGLGLYCIPPTGADTDIQVIFTSECETIFNHILNSFRFDP